MKSIDEETATAITRASRIQKEAGMRLEDHLDSDNFGSSADWSVRWCEIRAESLPCRESSGNSY